MDGFYPPPGMNPFFNGTIVSPGGTPSFSVPPPNLLLPDMTMPPPQLAVPPPNMSVPPPSIVSPSTSALPLMSRPPPPIVPASPIAMCGSYRPMLRADGAGAQQQVAVAPPNLPFVYNGSSQQQQLDLVANALAAQEQETLRDKDERTSRSSEDKGRERSSKRSSRSSSRTRSSRRRRSRSRSRSRSRRSRSGDRSARRRGDDRHRGRDRSRSPSRSRSPRRRRSRSTSREGRGHRRGRREFEPHHTIAIKGLPSECGEMELFALIREQGFQPKDIRILRKKETGQSRGFGFIEFLDVDSAKAWMDFTKGYLAVDAGHEAELQYSMEKNNWGSTGQQAAVSGQASVFGDWICAKCTMNNFKKRDHCFKCGLARIESDLMQERGFSAIGVTPCDTLLFRELPDRCDERRIEAALKRVSALTPVAISMAESRRFAYVQLKTPAEAAQMLAALTQITSLAIDGCEIAVSYSRVPLTTVLTGQTLSQTAEQLTRMQRSISANADVAAAIRNSQTDAANAAAAVAQSALRKAQVMRQVTSDVLSGQIEIMQAQKLAIAGLTAASTSSMSMLAQRQQQAVLAAQQQQPPPPPPPGTRTAQQPKPPNLGVVETPYGPLPKYPLPNTALYQFEATSGLYYDPTTGLYYDGNNSRYYYNTETQKWLYWDGNYCTFLPCEGQTAAASDASATTSSEQLQEEGKDEKLDAKAIQKQMDRWAKKQAKQKMTTTMPGVAGGSGGGRVSGSNPTPTAPQPISISLAPKPSPAADMAYAILEKTKSDDDEQEVAAGSATQRQLPVLDEATLIDTKKKACLLCKRQFPSIDVLNKHVQLSDLHKKNLEARRLELQQEQSGESTDEPGPSIQYRDRAKERRNKYGYDAVEESARHKAMKNEYLAAVEEDSAAAAAKVPIDGSNIGNKLLKSMGWNEGQGLGKNNQGIVAPVEAERRVAGAGLGAIGSKVTAAPNASFKECVKAAMRERFYELP